jgi:hypothetical protein
MRKGSPDHRQWQIIRRLQVVGCPLEADFLTRGPTHPLCVVKQENGGATNLFPTSSGFGLILPLRIVASVRITISRFDLLADWLNTPITWVPLCPQHTKNSQGCYCLHGTPLGAQKVEWKDGLNHRTGISLKAAVSPGYPDGGALKRFTEIRGSLVGTSLATFPATAGAKLNATLNIRDLVGEEYPYSVVIHNTQPVVRQQLSLP